MTNDNPQQPTAALSDLPTDELLRYGQELGLNLHQNTPRGELLRRIRQRQELLLELDRHALLDICVWARRPVRQSASKELLAREIAQVNKMDFAGLSHRGHLALARLRGLDVAPDEPDDQIAYKLTRAEPLADKLRRKRRTLVASLVSKLLQDPTQNEPVDYRFLPENPPPEDLKERIQQQGLVGGIASKLKGVADDYVRQKLDEIEARIDHKLDEIDHRLQEWRDREIANRLKIIKITLVASILVALLSLGYKYADRLLGRPAQPAGTPTSGQMFSGSFDARTI
jgi:hypothetical protein